MKVATILRRSKNAANDKMVWIEINAHGVGTAYFLSNCLKIDRVLVSASLQRLKRKGEVVNCGRYWEPAPPSPAK